MTCPYVHSYLTFSSICGTSLMCRHFICVGVKKKKKHEHYCDGIRGTKCRNRYFRWGAVAVIHVKVVIQKFSLRANDVTCVQLFWYIFCAGFNLFIFSEKLLFTPILNDYDTTTVLYIYRTNYGLSYHFTFS